MSAPRQVPSSAGPRKRASRRAASVADLVRTSTLDDEPFVLVVEATVPDVDLAAWLSANRARVLDDLDRYAAVLLRGFLVDSPASFGVAASGLTPQLLDYLERAAPRTEVAPHVFTSTEFSADQPIPLHHEMSYSHNWPSRLYFYCQQPATVGGATPMASERTVFPQIPEEVRDRFIRYGTRYVRNYGPHLDLPWQEVFQTTDRAEVEAYCRASHTEFAWIGADGLRTRSTRQAIATHPRTGETVWFNHAHLFHVSNMPAEVSGALISEYGYEGLPRNTYYGDGAPIEEEVATLIRRVYRQAAVAFRWQGGDVLVVDNFLAAHGREPFQGGRTVLVAMSDLYTGSDLYTALPAHETEANRGTA